MQSGVKFAETNLPCPCGRSSDAFTVNSDGSAKCFSCGDFFPNHSEPTEKRVSEKEKNENKKEVAYQYLPYAGIRADVMEFFGFKTAIAKDNSGPQYVVFPHPNGRIQNKTFEKKFWWAGEQERTDLPLFGMDKFVKGQGKAITVVEGAKDMAAVYQMFGKKYPVVAATNAQAAKTECGQAFEYLNSFEKIYLCLDSDGPGQEGMKAVASLFDFNKVYVVKMSKKDPAEYVLSKDDELFQKEWWAAQRYLPEGIFSSYDQFDKVIDEDNEKPAVAYPWERLQSMTYGCRTGELILLTAQEGMGKTEIFRALEYHFLKNTDDNIGIIHLEENKARSIKGLVGYELERPVHLPDFAIPKDELKSVFRKLTKRDDRVHLYSHFGSDDPDVFLNVIRFMAGHCGCKRIFADHITMMVSGLAGEDERKALDYISTRAAMMVEELDFTLFLISHVNDEGQTRGSRNIGKVADLRIDLRRNHLSENEDERNQTHLSISKNRYAGKTGPGGILKFNPDTYVLKEYNPENPDVPF